MQKRKAQILEAAVQEFINLGEPVSSGWLYKRHDFGIKPAMIRLELEELEREGFLEQPHHSAGRVPSDSGYEFFAERMLETEGARARRGLKNRLVRRDWPDLLEELSAELHLLGVIADFASDAVYKSGLKNLVEYFDWENREAIRGVVRDFEEMDERLPRAARKVGYGPKVFIGKKSPVTKSENLSVVGGSYTVRGAVVSVFAIGPKRMDYRKTLRIFKNL